MRHLTLYAAAIALLLFASPVFAQDSQEVPLEVPEASVQIDTVATTGFVRVLVVSLLEAAFPGMDARIVDKVATSAAALAVVALISLLQLFLGVRTKAQQLAGRLGDPEHPVGRFWEGNKGWLNPILAIVLGLASGGSFVTGILAAGLKGLGHAPIKALAEKATKADAAKARAGVLLALLVPLLMASPARAANNLTDPEPNFTEKLQFSAGVGARFVVAIDSGRPTIPFVAVQVGYLATKHLAIRGRLLRDALPGDGQDALWTRPQAELGLWVVW